MTNLTLDERHEFESLLAEYANAEMDCVRAHGRRHNAMHAVEDYVNARTQRIAGVAFHDGLVTPRQPPDVVPTGTPPPSSYYLPLTEESMALGARHDKGVAPVGDCCCATCCEVRTLASIGQPAEGLPFAAVQTGGVVQNSGN